MSKSCIITLLSTTIGYAHLQNWIKLPKGIQPIIPIANQIEITPAQKNLNLFFMRLKYWFDPKSKIENVLEKPFDKESIFYQNKKQIIPKGLYRLEKPGIFRLYKTQ
jgi:hypothetical protein